jgi:hypothetical protein
VSCYQSLSASLILAAITLAACDRSGAIDGSKGAGSVTLVNRVSATVRGENCPTCASTLETALQKRLNPVGITVNLERQTVDLEFPPSSPFASGSFREAVHEGGAEVQRIEIEACGTIDTVNGESWIRSGSARLLLDGPGPFLTGTEVCVNGELQDLQRPPRLIAGR